MSKGNSLGYDLKRNHVINSLGNNKTKEQYQKDLKKFNHYCKEIGINKLEKVTDPPTTIQGYANYLIDKGYSPHTIHTYLAPVCRAFKVNMDEIRKPKRHSANNTRSRGGKNPQGQREATKQEHQRLLTFCKCVGIRRSECKRLTGKNLKEIDGTLYVEVQKGKGGKYQLQYILPKDQDLVRTYFNGTSDKVFTPEELNNKLDLHQYRGIRAREAYAFFKDKVAHEPGYEAYLRRTLIDRYQTFNKQASKAALQRFIASTSNTPYQLRGTNRTLALEKGHPTEYDRLPLLAVSVLVLSHYRNDVTISNYMLT